MKWKKGGGKTPLYALVCGTFRLEFEFYTTLICLCELRKQGIIDGIVVSAWDEEEENIPGIHEKLEMLKIELVESPEPLLDFNYGEAIYLRQAVQVNAGLNIIPENAYVLKCRSDYSNFDINRFDVLKIPNYDWNLNQWGEFSTGKQSKTAVLRFGIGAPFAFHDICFMGSKTDLKKSIYFDNTTLSFENSIIADIWFFAGYYVNRFRIIKDFFRYIRLCEFHQGMNNLHILQEDFYLPSFLNKFYALYFLIIYSDYCIYHDMPLSDGVQLKIEDVFYSNPEYGIRKDWVVEIRCFDVIRKIVKGEVETSKGYDGIYSEICKIKKLSYAEQLRYEASDYEEMAAWGKKYFGYEPRKWLKNFRELKPVNKDEIADIGFEESAQLLFSDYSVNEKTYEAIRDIAFNKRSYYSTVISYLDDFKEVDEELYKKALFSSTRYFDDKVLRNVAKLLVDGKAQGKDIKEACFMFKRFAHDERLYRFPMNADRICALLHYIFYQEQTEGTSDVAEEFIIRLLDYYGMNQSENYIRNYEYLECLLDEISKREIGIGTDRFEEKIQMQECIKVALRDERLVCEHANIGT